MREFIVGFPRCGTQSYGATYKVDAHEDLIYKSNGVQYFQDTFPGHVPIVLIRLDRWEHAYSLWSRACKMEGEKRAFINCSNEYYEKSDFEKYLKPWRAAYPDIVIHTLEDLIKRPGFLKIDNFSLPHSWKDYCQAMNIK